VIGPKASWLPREFPERFFGPGNTLRWKDIQERRLKAAILEELAPWLDDLRTEADPLCLPCVREGGRVEWYALSATDRGARALREQLIAFVGPSYAGPWADWSRLEATDPVEEAVMRAAPGRAYRLRVPRLELKDKVREKLRYMRALHKERPSRLAFIPRPTGRILGDFEHALRCRDGAAAAAHIDELRRLGRLSAQNQLFLEVLRAECLLDWEYIVEPRRFELLLTLSRPRRVTQALIRAYYARNLRSFEETSDAAGAVRYFGKTWEACGSLFRTHQGMAAPEVSHCFMMVAAVAQPPRPGLRDELLAALPASAPERFYLDALAALVPSPRDAGPTPGLGAARQAFEAGDVDRAFQEALASPMSLEQLALVLRCARELDTLDAARKAIAAVESTSAHARETLLGRAPLRAHYDSLYELATKPRVPREVVPTPAVVIPADPGGWLELLREERLWPGALEVVERGVREWRRSEWVGNPARVAATAKALGAVRPPWGEETLRMGLPHLLSFFLPPEGRPERVLKPVLEQLATIIELDEQARVEQLHALSEVTEALLGIGLSSDEYRSVLGSLRETWERVGAGSLGDWALDTLDMLVVQPAADKEERTQFFHKVTAYLRQHLRRTSREQLLLLQGLAKELSLDVPEDLGRKLRVGSGEDAEAGRGLAKLLAGRRIALYSLKEAVLGRVEQVIMQLAPTARVACFQDKVGGSSALKQQAETADIFVIATAAAKHAATGFIAAHRPPGATTLYAAGQGSASMLRALSEWEG
jgi:hypothetical protein